MCGLVWGAHKSLAPRARTLLGGLGNATLSSFAVATLLFVLFGECPKFCDLAKQRRKIVGGVSEVEKDVFSLHFFWRCVIFLVSFFLLLRSRDRPTDRPTDRNVIRPIFWHEYQIVMPTDCIPALLKRTHESNGYVDADRTFKMFKK